MMNRIAITIPFNMSRPISHDVLKESGGGRQRIFSGAVFSYKLKDDLHQFGGFDRLRQMLLEACGERAKAVLLFGMSGQRDGRNPTKLVVQVAYFLNQHVSIFVWHCNVDDQYVRVVTSDDMQGVLRR